MWQAEEAEGRATPILLLVVISLLMASTVAYVASMVGDFGGEQPPQLAFYDGGGEANLTVVKATITHGSLAWSDLEVVGCDASHLSGPVRGGDALRNCDRPFSVRHIPTDTIVYELK